MKNLTSILFVFIFASGFVIGQRSESEIALREYFIDAEFFLAQEFYSDALSDYLQVYRRGYSENPNINYRIGICYLNITGQKHKSIEYLEKAKNFASVKFKESTLKEQHAPIDVYLYLGNAYRVNNRLENAVEAYNTYISLLPEDEVNLHKYARQQIEACNMAAEFMKDPVDVVFENFGQIINGSRDSYKAVLSGDGLTLAYMRRLPFYDGVFVARKKAGKWSRPVNITPQIRSDGNQFITSISYEGNMLLLTKEDEYNSDIYVSHYVDNRWQPSKSVGENINTKYWESHADISKDGKILYFTSNKKGGVGEMDLYKSKLSEEGTWSIPENLGENINTELNEDTPFITEDGKTLYFSSQGYTSMGGYDIYVSQLDSENEWQIPQNLGYPVSTTDNDLFYYPWNNGEIGLMALIREDGYGARDIYKLRYTRGKMPEMVEDEIEEELSESPVQEALPEKQESAQELPPEQEVKTVNLSPVLFGFDKTNLTSQGKKELLKLADLLKNYLNLKVDLLGYTDALGPEYYNLKLSELRAVSAKKYLVEKGVSASRIKTVGKGETEFIAANVKNDGSDYPEGRKYNRRIEFEIIGIDEKKIMIKRLNPVPEDFRLPQK